MSGVEAAGFVLAVFPLLISGLEHYANGTEIIRRAWNYSREFKSLARKLGAEMTIFQNSIQLLLDDCVDTDVQRKLLEDVGGKGWSEPAIEKALRKRLRTSFNSYIECVRGISETIAKLQQRLGMSRDNKIPYDDRTSFKKAYKSLGHAVRDSKYKELIRDIRDDNVVLERLSTQAYLLQKSQSSKRLPDFDKTRLEATSIFECLKEGLFATCRVPHRLSLYLELEKDDANRPKPKRISDEDGAFRIVMYHEFAPGTQQPAWVIEEAEVRSIDARIAPSHNRSSSSFSDNSAAQVGTQRTTIRIREPSNAAGSHEMPLRPRQMIPEQQQNLTEIRDLCESMHRYRNVGIGSCLGYVTGRSSYSRHGLYRPRERLLDRTMTLSLAHILGGRADQFGCRLRHADSHWLAASLTSAMLRLHDTPWIPKDWSNKDIMLISQHGRLLSHHPLISRGVYGLSTDNQTASRESSMAQCVIKNPALYRLGILLIELCMDQPMHEMYLPDEVNRNGTAHELSDYYAATRLLEQEEIRDKFGKRWSDAVYRCINCSVLKPSLQDADLRKEFYNGVVLELEEAYRQFCDL